MALADNIGYLAGKGARTDLDIDKSVGGSAAQLLALPTLSAARQGVGLASGMVRAGKAFAAGARGEAIPDDPMLPSQVNVGKIARVPAATTAGNDTNKGVDSMLPPPVQVTPTMDTPTMNTPTPPVQPSGLPAFATTYDPANPKQIVVSGNRVPHANGDGGFSQGNSYTNLPAGVGADTPAAVAINGAQPSPMTIDQANAFYKEQGRKADLNDKMDEMGRLVAAGPNGFYDTARYLANARNYSKMLGMQAPGSAQDVEQVRADAAQRTGEARNATELEKERIAGGYKVQEAGAKANGDLARAHIEFDAKNAGQLATNDIVAQGSKSPYYPGFSQYQRAMHPEPVKFIPDPINGGVYVGSNAADTSYLPSPMPSIPGKGTVASTITPVRVAVPEAHLAATPYAKAVINYGGKRYLVGADGISTSEIK